MSNAMGSGSCPPSREARLNHLIGTFLHHIPAEDYLEVFRKIFTSNDPVESSRNLLSEILGQDRGYQAMRDIVKQVVYLFTQTGDDWIDDLTNDAVVVLYQSFVPKGRACEPFEWLKGMVNWVEQRVKRQVQKINRDHQRFISLSFSSSDEEDENLSSVEKAELIINHKKYPPAEINPSEEKEISLLANDLEKASKTKAVYYTKKKNRIDAMEILVFTSSDLSEKFGKNTKSKKREA